MILFVNIFEHDNVFFVGLLCNIASYPILHMLLSCCFSLTLNPFTHPFANSSHSLFQADFSPFRFCCTPPLFTHPPSLHPRKTSVLLLLNPNHVARSDFLERGAIPDLTLTLRDQKCHPGSRYTILQAIKKLQKRVFNPLVNSFGKMKLYHLHHWEAMLRLSPTATCLLYSQARQSLETGGTSPPPFHKVSCFTIFT